MLGFGEMEGEWGYTNMWQGPPPTGSGSEARDRESRDMEGLTMDTKSGTFTYSCTDFIHMLILF